MDTSIDIVTRGTAGLRHDAEVIHRALSPVYQTRIHVLRDRNAHMLHRRLIKELMDRLFTTRRLLLFLNDLPTPWMRLAGTRILVPNQEWVGEEVLKNLPDCAQVWCKTRHAEKAFRQRGYDARFIGFSSRDVYRPGHRKDYRKFIHVGGRSHLKGTRAILDLWKQHPEWPTLLVITAHEAWRNVRAPNLIFRKNDIPPEELYALMNEHGIHLCPSEVEGFGHYISEGLSTKALVITVAAPPMNEIVTSEYGLLAGYHKSEPMSFGERFFVDPQDLERQVHAALQMSAAEAASMGEAARAAFLERDAAFASRLLPAVAGHLASQACPA